MIIQIENKSYKLISTDDESIRLDHKNPDLPVIYAATTLPLDEVVLFVKQFSKKNKLKPKVDSISLEFFTINLFDKSFSVKPLSDGHSKPYLKNNIIYYSKPALLFKSNEKLTKFIVEYIFEQTILNLCAKWEEKLQILVEEVNFKKLKTNYFTTDGSKIVFNRNNEKFNLRINEYLLFCAILKLLNANIQVKVRLVEEHFPDKIQIEKLLKYGC